MICRVNNVGERERLCYRGATYNSCYTSDVVWWNNSEVSFGDGPHDWDSTVISLKKRKLGSVKSV